MTDPRSETTRTARVVPPSFTPQGTPGRPGADDAIAVGHGPGAGGRGSSAAEEPGADTPGAGVPAVPSAARSTGRPDPVVPEPRIKRQSSREVPVTGERKEPHGPRGDLPRSVPPRSQQPQSIRPTGRRGTQPAGAQPGSIAPGSVPPRAVPPRQSPVRPAPARQAPPRQVTSGAAGVVRAGTAAPARPGGPRPPAGQSLGSSGSGGFRVRKGRVAGLVAVLLLVALIAWPVGLLIWANGKIQHVDALSGASDTPGTTFLLAGSDARGSGGIEDETSGARTDTIMLLHKPESGPSALISLPRDTYVEIPGVGGGKLNAAYSYGGPTLLVQTVEQLTGLTVDHYVEVGFGGIQGVVDAVGGVELCLDIPNATYPLVDANSGLVWPQAGCQVVDGTTAIAFSRMRYSDPEGDVGRAARQRQLIGKLGDKLADPALLANPAGQVALIDTGLAAITTDQETGILDLGLLALTFRAASGTEGVTGTPPISSLDYRPGNVGSTVQLDPETVGQFWTDLRDGNLAPGQVGGIPQ